MMNACYIRPVKGNHSCARCTFRFILLLFLVMCIFGLPAKPAGAASADTPTDSWAVLGGYGQSIPGWGMTTQRVQTIDVIPRYNHAIFTIGSGWYRGFHSILIELPVDFVVSPDVSAMVGANFLACYTFTANKVLRPYLFGGGGPVYSFADIPGMGARLNGNYQFGIGLEYRRADSRNLLFEVRYHHISNAGTADPNEPLNSFKLLVGIMF